MQRKFRAFFHDDVKLINGRCPQQKNAYDCGLYVIVIVEQFCRFIYENYVVKQSDKSQCDKNLFEKLMNSINQSITSESINQRRKQLKTVLESMSINKGK